MNGGTGHYIKKTTICVLIMFTNEEHCILETIKSTLPYAYEYILLDNNSTDNTVKVCEEFLKDNNIKYQVFTSKWVNFGYNCSLLYELGHKHSKADYLWQIDADDLVHGKMNMDYLWADQYLLKFGGNLYYERHQLFKNDTLYRHYLSIHGYVTTVPKFLPKSSQTLEGDYYIECRHVGSRHHIDMKTKFLNDAKMLEEDLKTNLDIADRNRCYFYLAQSYSCAGLYQEAITIYKKRVYLQGWHEEVRHSRLQIARCYFELKDYTNVIKFYLKCFEKHPYVAEPLYELGLFYFENKLYLNAKRCFKQASQIPYPSHLKLFLSKNIYDYSAKLMLACCYYYLNKYNKSYDINMELLKLNLSDDIRKIIEKNNQFNCIKTIV